MNRCKLSHGILTMAFVLSIVAVWPAAALGAQSFKPERVLAWIEVDRESRGFATWLRTRIQSLTDYVVRATSPDVEQESRRLWVITLNGGTKCLLSREFGVWEPRWGKGGYILFLIHTDTNNDGQIDFNDEYLVRIIPEQGGEGKTVGRARSAAWSPHGKLIALVSEGKVVIVDLEGRPVAVGRGAATGKIVVSDNRHPARAKTIWALDAGDASIEALDSALLKKYLWLEAMAPDGVTVAFTNAQQTDIFVGSGQNPATAQNVTQDEYLDFDPAWSPTQAQLVYVSSNPSNGKVCQR